MGSLLPLPGSVHPAWSSNTRSTIASLRAAGMFGPAYLREASHGDGSAPPLFHLLVALGRKNLSAARLFEGHVNAVQLIARLGTEQQKSDMLTVATAGGLFGVWGADDPAMPGVITNGGELHGRKTFASGANSVERAVVAVKNSGRKTQLVLLDSDTLAGRIDGDWHPLGMQETDSTGIRLEGLTIDSESLLGGPGLYEQQPFFGAGAIRFVAAQLGGAIGIWDATRDHLDKTGRYRDSHQASRLAEILADLEATFCLVRVSYTRVATSIAWEENGTGDDHARIADVARIAVEAMIDRLMLLAMRSVGCAGLMDSHPLSKAIRDLMVYVRQPAPDAARVRVGQAAGEGSYQPVFDDR